MHVMVLTYGEPKKGYLNFTLGNLWATQPIALLIWPPLQVLKLIISDSQNRHQQTVIVLHGMVRLSSYQCVCV